MTFSKFALFRIALALCVLLGGTCYSAYVAIVERNVPGAILFGAIFCVLAGLIASKHD